MKNMPQLCLGTAQFGLSYGVTNQEGQVNKEEVRRILETASSSGITLLDTAQAYGSSEKVLGSCWPADAPRRLISKLPPGESRFNWEANFMKSLEYLQADKLDAFLLHRSSDLLETNGSVLLEWLESLRDRGLVDRIGISIYDSSELDDLPLDRIDLVQLPLSIYDQRLMLDGTVERLQNMGIAVHARSVLLQGLLLCPPHDWPEYLSTEFRQHHSRWLECVNQSLLSPLSSALSFVCACEGVEAVLIGVLTQIELKEVLRSWQEIHTSSLATQAIWAWQNSLDLDPRLWPPQ